MKGFEAYCRRNKNLCKCLVKMRKWGLSNKLVLYVKSEKIFRTQYSEGVPGHSCTAAYRASETVCDYKPKDKEAIDLLEKEGIQYRLVDLSNCSPIFNLKAKIFGLSARAKNRILRITRNCAT